MMVNDVKLQEDGTKNFIIVEVYWHIWGDTAVQDSEFWKVSAKAPDVCF